MGNKSNAKTWLVVVLVALLLLNLASTPLREGFGALFGESGDSSDKSDNGSDTGSDTGSDNDTDGGGTNGQPSLFWGAPAYGGITKEGRDKVTQLCKPVSGIEGEDITDALKEGRVSKSWAKDGKFSSQVDPSCKGDCKLKPGWSQYIGCSIFAVDDPDGGKKAALDLCGKVPGCVGVNWTNMTGWATAADGIKADPKQPDLYVYEIMSADPSGCQTLQTKNTDDWTKFCKGFGSSKLGPAFSSPRKITELNDYLGPLPIVGKPPGSVPSMCELGSCGDDECPITISGSAQTGSKVTSCWGQSDNLKSAVAQNKKPGDADNYYAKMGKYAGSYAKSGGSLLPSSGAGGMGGRLMDDIKSVGKDIGDMF